MTRETKRSTTRNSKRSARRNANSTKKPAEAEVEEKEIDNYDSLNTSEQIIPNEEEKIGNNNIEVSLPSPSMESSQPDIVEQNKEEMVKIEDVSTVEKEEKESSSPIDNVIESNTEELESTILKLRESKAPEPKSSVFPSRSESSTIPPRHVAPTKTLLAKEPSFFQGPLIRYGSIVLGVLVFYFLFLRKGSDKKNDKNSAAPTGPTIVDVTEVKEGSSSSGNDGDEKKSVKSSVNRVSSPRIVFGDLRKNPSLMVAPPMTPAVGSRA